MIKCVFFCCGLSACDIWRKFWCKLLTLSPGCSSVSRDQNLFSVKFIYANATSQIHVDPSKVRSFTHNFLSRTSSRETSVLCSASYCVLAIRTNGSAVRHLVTPGLHDQLYCAILRIEQYYWLDLMLKIAQWLNENLSQFNFLHHIFTLHRLGSILRCLSVRSSSWQGVRP